MKFKFYGVRGSIPQPEPEMMKYGGHTTCIHVLSEKGDEYILDAGSGIKRLGLELMARHHGKVKARLFITHDHWDHIQGFPFFVPAYVPGCEIDVYSGDKKMHHTLNQQNQKSDTALLRRSELERAVAGHTVVFNKGKETNHTKNVFTGQQNVAAGYFPVSVEQMLAQIRFHDLKQYEVVENGIKVRFKYFNDQAHPGGMFSYELKEEEKRVVFAGDYEHDGTDYGNFGTNDREMIAWAEGADVFICDGQYTPEEYLGKKKWGHSQFERVCELAAAAHVRALYITHHDPEHTDLALSQMEEQAKQFMKNHLKADIQVSFAKQKQEILI